MEGVHVGEGGVLLPLAAEAVEGGNQALPCPVTPPMSPSKAAPAVVAQQEVSVG